MKRGEQVLYLVAVVALFVAGGGVLAFREHLPTLLVVPLVLVDLAVIAVLVVLARRKR